MIKKQNRRFPTTMNIIWMYTHTLSHTHFRLTSKNIRKTHTQTVYFPLLFRLAHNKCLRGEFTYIFFIFSHAPFAHELSHIFRDREGSFSEVCIAHTSFLESDSSNDPFLLGGWIIIEKFHNIIRTSRTSSAPVRFYTK